ncbi:MAG: hypothetical protein ABSB80_12800 [Methanoregula sp.]|jgi:PHD/YefM family antitoxin component YafN of YafNO toxin-antitoxin module|uniref:hypothetical protein n=1 Tax=Methanoregula sp. TaxID=2052170 RepID=UPI003D09D55E
MSETADHPEEGETTPCEDDKVTISRQEYDALIALKEQAYDRPSFWSDALKNPEGVEKLAKAAKEIIDSAATAMVKSQITTLKYSVIRILIVILLLGAIIWSASQLVQSGKLDGGSLTFLLGTIVGYLLTFLSKVELSG